MTSKDNMAPVYGLVLAGGRSMRMGADKSTLQWHGKEQRYYMADLLNDLCTEVFISCRPEQQAGIADPYKSLPDSYTGLGPYGAILTAFKYNPHVAWLVVACDLPLLDISTLRQLLAERDTSYIATTFKSPFDGLPEPLITIWEPASLDPLHSFLAGGRSCPRKALIQHAEKVKIIAPANADALMNANTPADAEKANMLLMHK